MISLKDLTKPKPSQHLHMAEFVGNGEGSAQAVVLADAAAPVWIAHRPQLCKA